MVFIYLLFFYKTEDLWSGAQLDLCEIIQAKTDGTSYRVWLVEASYLPYPKFSTYWPVYANAEFLLKKSIWTVMDVGW